MNQRHIDLSNYRLEKAKEHLKAAEKLFEEKLFKDSVSRSYYSIFSATRALLALKKLDSKKHKGIISLFNKTFVKTKIVKIKASKIIKEAKIYRENVDYADFLIITKDEAKQQLIN